MQKENIEREVTIKYILNAPPTLVFQAWTDRQFLEQWYAPDGCTVSIKKMDARKGGSFFGFIGNPKSYDCWFLGEYLEFDKPAKLVFSLETTDKNGNSANPVDLGMDPEWPAKTIVTVLFTAVDQGTEMTLHQTVAEKLAKKTGAHPSWILMFERLQLELQKTFIHS